MEKFPMENSERPETAGKVNKEGEKIAEKTASPEVMRKYLYSFAYTTPGRPETELGRDLEDVRELFIIADSRERALEFGRQFSDAYLKNLREETGGFIGKGAEWVESEDELHAGEDYSKIPVLRHGETADIRAIFRVMKEREG